MKGVIIGQEQMRSIGIAILGGLTGYGKAYMGLHID